MLGSYTDTYSIVKVHGEKCLDFIFSIIDNAGWNKETNGYATFVMRALREVWIAHPNDRKEIHSFLSKELRQIDPALFSAEAKSKYPKRDHRVSCVLYVEDLVCDSLVQIFRSVHKYDSIQPIHALLRSYKTSSLTIYNRKSVFFGMRN